MWLKHIEPMPFKFSSNWPTEPIRPSSCDVRVFVCPLSMQFFYASHWPSDHMISSRPLIGQPFFPTTWWLWGAWQIIVFK